MPELPEVETVRNTLKKSLVGKTIKNVTINYEGIIETDINLFKINIEKRTIIDILRVGKWLIFDLGDYYLLSHLRMEGKYFIKPNNDIVLKHEHVIFHFDDCSLRYHDTRKFGKMYLVLKERLYLDTPLKDLGLEPFDKNFNVDYLKRKILKNKPVKSLLLDQHIISGIGNIYADEILFLSKINPFCNGNRLTNKDLLNIITMSRDVLSKAIIEGGTTIRSYTSSLGVTGNYQHELNVHCKEGEECHICGNVILKTSIQGRGTYYCPNCQKE